MTSGDEGAPSSVRVGLWALLVFALSCAVLLSVFAWGFLPVQADETTLAWQAKLARDGYAPYRDYFAFKPPLLIYMPAAVFAAFGSSLATLRLFSVVALAGTAVILFLLCVRARMGTDWAAGTALVLPALLVPFWPVPSGQWFALAFGLSALLCVATPQPRLSAVFAGGVLAALAGLCVQTHGVLFAGLLAIRLLTGPETRTLRHLAVAAGGTVLPLLAAVLLLWRAGILPDAFDHVVLWPLQYYRQPGGFNDASPESVSEGLAEVTTIPWTFAAVGSLVPGAVAMLFATAVPSITTVSSLLLWRRGLRGPRANFALAGSLLLWIVFALGKMDQPHLVFLAPVFIWLLAQHVDWSRAGRRPPLLRAWVVLALLLMLRWPLHWLQQPPSVAAVASVDTRWADTGLPTLLDDLPQAVTYNLPVLHLSPDGSALYIAWAPAAPPVDWLYPPAFRYNSPAEYGAVAAFADEHAVPYVVIPLSLHELWLRDPSPIRDLLRERYRRAFGTKWGVVYCRNDAVLPGRAEQVCALPRT